MKTSRKILFFNLFFLGLIILCSNQIYAHGGDTLKCHLETATPTLIPISNTGYVSGNNGFGDIEIAQKYGVDSVDLLNPCNATDSATMSEVQVWFGKKVVGINGNVIVKVYSSNPLTGTPDQLLSTSFPLSMNSLGASTTIDTLTEFLLQTPITITDTFFVSVVLPTSSGDSVAIISDMNGQGQNMKLGWIKDSNNVWSAVQTLRNLDIDFAIYPNVVDPATGIKENNIFKDIVFYPNPSKEFLTINFKDLDILNEVSYLEILDVNGKLQKKIIPLPEIKQNIKISQLTAGIYFLNIIGKKAIKHLKFVIAE